MKDLNNETKENMLQRLAKYLKVRFKNLKHVKKVATLALVSAIVLTQFIGCNNTNNNPGTTPPGQEQESQYSQLLQNVLTSNYYNTLIENAKNNSNVYNSGYMDPHPYAFLQQQGYDIDAIKNNQLECFTCSYILENEPNNLYINTRVENAGNYYTNYLLKYQLSAKEISDYCLTHDEPTDATTYYIQSVFMNDAISKAKTATIVSKTNIDKTAFAELQDSIGGSNSTNEMTGSKFNDIIFTNLQAKTFDVYAYPTQYSDTSMTCSTKLAYIPCRAFGENFKITNNVYYGPTYYSGYKLANNFSKENVEKIKLFTPQNVNLNIMFCDNLK